MRGVGWVLSASTAACLACTARPVTTTAMPPSPPTPAIDVASAVASSDADRARLDEAITKAVVEEHTWPRPAVPVVDTTPAKEEPTTRLGRDVCAGPPLPKEKPRTRKATCCYPAKESLVRPIRAVYPALRACYEARTKAGAEGRALFSFRIEQDGSVKRVCAKDSSVMDDEPAARCMANALLALRYPAMSDDERDLCGLVTLSYPIVFEP